MTALRVGVVGVGIMGADHVERLARRTAGVELVAVSDPATARAQALAGRFEGVQAIADPLELIAAEDVDAVVIASPGFAHEEQVLAALEQGKPVLCEKPLTMDSASSVRLLRAEQAAGRALVSVGFMRRFDPEYAAMRATIVAGELGRPLLLHNVHRNKAAAPGFRSEMIVRDSLVHEVDVARFLLGEEIVQIDVLSPAPTRHAPEGVVDPQLAVFTMAGGALVTNEVFVNSQIGYEVRAEAVCERGTLTLGLGEGVVRRAANAWGGTVPDDYRARFARAYDLELQAWADASRLGQVVGATAWDGYAATAVCTAGLESLREGRPVSVHLVDPLTLEPQS